MPTGEKEERGLPSRRPQGRITLAYNPHLVDAGSKAQGTHALLGARELGVDVDEHEGLSVTPEARLEEVSELAVPADTTRTGSLPSRSISRDTSTPGG